MQQKKHPTLIIILACVIVIVCFSLAAIIITFSNQIRESYQIGQLIYTNEPNETILSLFDPLDPEVIGIKHDIEISTYTTTDMQNIQNTSDILYNIRVPATDYYNSILNISSNDLYNFNKNIKIIPIQELEANLRLLSIDDQYYLDSFTSGALFDFLHLSGETEDIEKIVATLAPNLPDFPTSDTVLTLAQTGVTALSRGMYTKLRNVTDASYFATNLVDFFSKFDYKHTSNEASFSTLANSSNICSAPTMIDVITSLDFNIIELTGNHNLDCGDNDALSTLATYADLNIQIVGGGATADLAAQPLEIEAKNTNITLLAYNYSTGGYTLDQTPGANFFTIEKVTTDIENAKERGDFAIVDVQFFECNAYDNIAEDTTCDYANSSEGDQVTFFRQLIDLGANIVVGTSAHQPQTFERYKDGYIYYGLGNLFFDQAWWPGTTRSLILVHYFQNNELLQTRIVPTVYDQNYQTKLMDNKTAEWFINRLNRARPQE